MARYTVRENRNGSIRTISGIHATSGEGAIIRAVDMFKVRRESCTFEQEEA